MAPSGDSTGLGVRVTAREGNTGGLAEVVGRFAKRPRLFESLPGATGRAVRPSWGRVETPVGIGVASEVV